MVSFVQARAAAITLWTTMAEICTYIRYLQGAIGGTVLSTAVTFFLCIGQMTTKGSIKNTKLPSGPIDQCPAANVTSMIMNVTSSYLNMTSDYEDVTSFGPSVTNENLKIGNP